MVSLFWLFVYEWSGHTCPRHAFNQIIPVEMSYGIAILRMSGPVGNHGSYKTIRTSKRKRGEQIKRSPVPYRLEEAVRPFKRETRLTIPAFTSMDEDVVLVVSKIARIRKKPSNSLRKLILAMWTAWY